MYKSNWSFWQGFPPPQCVYSNMEFKGVALQPPNSAAPSLNGAVERALVYECRL